MCAVSNIGDSYGQRWQGPVNVEPQSPFLGGSGQITIGPSRYEFDDLKREVMEMKKLLLEAKDADRRAGNPDCEMEAKIKILRTVADAVGINLDEVFGKPKTATEGGGE